MFLIGAALSDSSFAFLDFCLKTWFKQRFNSQSTLPHKYTYRGWWNPPKVVIPQFALHFWRAVLRQKGSDLCWASIFCSKSQFWKWKQTLPCWCTCQFVAVWCAAAKPWGMTICLAPFFLTFLGQAHTGILACLLSVPAKGRCCYATVHQPPQASFSTEN